VRIFAFLLLWAIIESDQARIEVGAGLLKVPKGVGKKSGFGALAGLRDRPLPVLTAGRVNFTFSVPNRHAEGKELRGWNIATARNNRFVLIDSLHPQNFSADGLGKNKTVKADADKAGHA